MAKGWLGRGRAPSNEPQVDSIGSPDLTWSDAAPRTDLQQLGYVTPAATTGRSRGISNAGERPRTAGDRAGPPPRFNIRPGLPNAQSFDTELPRPRPPMLDLHRAPPDDGMIGMALGSPSHVPMKPAPLQQSPLVNTQNLYEDLEDHKTKGGKWKKLGGLFKARTALSNQPSPAGPFYSLQTPTTADPSPAVQAPAKQIAAFSASSEVPVGYGVPEKAQRVMGGANSRPSVDTYRSGSRSRSRSDATSHRYANSKESVGSFHVQNNLSTFESSPMFLGGLPSLDIEIPDSQMERYSVMFSGILGNSKSSNLLARRSRMLEKLRTIADDAENTQTEPVPELPEIPKIAKGESHLTPHSQVRRATSPTPGKSPSFVLFPHQANGQAIEGSVTSGPSNKSTTLQRSHTAPSHSPRRQAFDFELNAAEEPEVIVESPGQTTSSSHRRPKWGSDGSYLSPTSTAGTDHQDDDIIFNVKAVSVLNESEPQWEMVSTDNVNELHAGEARRNLRAVRQPSPLAEVAVENPRGPIINDEALAALEAPAPRGQDLAPLRPTKAAIDRIMSPPPMDRKPLPAIAPSEENRPAIHVPKLRVRQRGESTSRPTPAAAPTKSQSPTPSALSRDPPVDIYVPRLRVRGRDDATAQQAKSQATETPAVGSSTSMALNLDDLDEIEQQIESRAVRAMKKQAAARDQSVTSDASLPSSVPAQKRDPPVRSATTDAVDSSMFPMPDSRLPRRVRTEGPTTGENFLNRAMSLDNVKSAVPKPGAYKEKFKPRPLLTTAASATALRQNSPLDMVRAMSPAPLNHRNPDDLDDDVDTTDFRAPAFVLNTPTTTSAFSSNPPTADIGQVQVARSISVSKRQKQTIVPISSGSSIKRRNNNNTSDPKVETPSPLALAISAPVEEPIERHAKGGMKPEIVDFDSADGAGGRLASPNGIGDAAGNYSSVGLSVGDDGWKRGHRYEKSMNAVVESV